ncbi:MAG: chromosome partitioning protein ParB [Pseudomonadota bacterium]
MSDDPFAIPLNRSALRSRRKDTKPESVAKSDAAGERLGFVEREPKKKRGRKPSPRTGQVHAKVMPNVARAIGQEARNRGVQQGVIIEEAWELYLARQQHQADGD